MTTSVLDIVNNAPMLFRTMQNGRPMPVYMSGPPGCGKSALVETVLPNVLEGHFFHDVEPVKREAKPNVRWSAGGTVAVVTEILSTMEYVDIRGVQYPIKDKDTGRHEQVWLVPNLVRTEQWCYDQGAKIVVLFFDELPQANADVQKAVTDVKLNGRIGSHGLRRTTWCWSAGNRTKDQAGANRLLSILRNRVINYEVSMPVAPYVAWAKDNGMVPVVSSFVEFRSDLLADVQPTKEGPFLTNRSLFQASQAINEFRKAEKITDPMVLPGSAFARDTVSGIIGEPAMVELYAFADTAADLPKIADIARDPMGAKLPSSEKMAAQYAVAGLITSGATLSNFSQMWKYAERLMRDMQVKIANDLLASPEFGGALYNAPEFSKWLATNRSLVRATFTV